MMIVKGKLVWDTDGWFEIHPQGCGDVRFDSMPDASQAGTAAELAALLPAILDRAWTPSLPAWSGFALSLREIRLARSQRGRLKREL